MSDIVFDKIVREVKDKDGGWIIVFRALADGKPFRAAALITDELYQDKPALDAFIRHTIKVEGNELLKTK